MMLTKDATGLNNFKEAVQYEWLETNGLGGWSSSSIIHTHTRRYHGLLVAATTPPAGRTVLLSKLDETVVVDGERFELGCNLYNSNVVHPNGNNFITHFQKGLFPEWTYEVGDLKFKKTLAMLHGENSVVIIYEILNANQTFTMEWLPLAAGRFYHTLQREGEQMHWDADFNDGIFHNQPDGILNVYISIPGSNYTHTPRWFKNFTYNIETYRGLDDTEDLFNHGTFAVQLQQGSTIAVLLSTENPAGRDAQDLFAKEYARRQQLLQDQPKDELIQQLVLAADQFIVQRNILQESPMAEPGGETAGATVIAGYHWFTDWGRDTMISLPGLCLHTGRFDDAKKILSAFAQSVSMGMLPNRFQDNQEPPEYNNVDGTLWYFIAVYQYLQKTGDTAFVLQRILPLLKEIIDWHFKGTRYSIHTDIDGLLFAGEPGQQLTWMDARIGDWVVTPRMGKPVEIQALWYNALKIFASLLLLNNEKSSAAIIELAATKAKSSFIKLFWNDACNCLYDVIDEKGMPDPSCRPNQLFAVSLPFPLVHGAAAEKIIEVVTEKLYTPVGLKSLPADDRRYVHQYGGDQWHRDASYHQGTVWSWLLGAYVDAIMKTQGAKGKFNALQVIAHFKYHLNEGCIGSVSEIFDADAPHHPRGCVAQAWGVAEILRVIKEYGLYDAE